MWDSDLTFFLPIENKVVAIAAAECHLYHILNSYIYFERLIDFILYPFNLLVYSSVTMILIKLFLVYNSISVLDRKRPHSLFLFFIFEKYCPFLSPKATHHHQSHLRVIVIRLILENLSTIWNIPILQHCMYLYIMKSVLNDSVTCSSHWFYILLVNCTHRNVISYAPKMNRHFFAMYFLWQYY